MSGITKIFNENNFASIFEVKKLFENAPYFFEVKETNDLLMLCMTDKTDLTSSINREATGIIFEKETYKLVHHSFSKAYDSLDNFDKSKILDTDKIVVDLYFEGSMIKLYYFNGMWNTGTARHITASQNRWCSKKSFDVLFKETIRNSYNCTVKEFEESLSKDHCYTFLFQHPDHPMTMPIASPVCFPLNRVNVFTLEEENEEKGNLTTGLSLNEIGSKSKINENYLIYHLDKNGLIKNRIKCLSRNYLDTKEKVGNFPNLGLRYIEAFNSTEHKIFLRGQFPQYCDTFNKIELSIHKAANRIHFLYIEHNIKKNDSIEIPKRYIRTINQLHGQYRKTKQKIMLYDVYDKILILQPRTVAYIIDYIY